MTCPVDATYSNSHRNNSHLGDRCKTLASRSGVGATALTASTFWRQMAHSAGFVEAQVMQRHVSVCVSAVHLDSAPEEMAQPSHPEQCPVTRQDLSLTHFALTLFGSPCRIAKACLWMTSWTRTFYLHLPHKCLSLLSQNNHIDRPWADLGPGGPGLGQIWKNKWAQFGSGWEHVGSVRDRCCIVLVS